MIFRQSEHSVPHEILFEPSSNCKRRPWSVNSINLAKRSTSVLKLRHADNKFSIVHLFTRSLAGWLACSFVRSFIHSFIHLLIHLFMLLVFRPQTDFI